MVRVAEDGGCFVVRVAEDGGVLWLGLLKMGVSCGWGC